MKKWFSITVPLLAGVLLYLILHWSLIQTIDRCTLVVQSDQSQMLTLYYFNSEGKGYREDQSVSLAISQNSGKTNLTEAIPPGHIARLRIDPVVNIGSLTISSISFNNSSFPVIVMKPGDIASSFQFHRTEILHLDDNSLTLQATAEDPYLVLKEIPPLSFNGELLIVCLTLSTLIAWSYRCLPNKLKLLLIFNADYIFAILAAGFTIFVFFPGTMSGDSLDQWRQVIHPEKINNWHPPIMVHIWIFINYFIPGPQGLLVYHVVLYFLAVAIFGRIFFTSMSARLGYLLVIGFFPTTYLMIGAIWKDVSMLVSVSLAVGLLTQFIKTEKKILLLLSLAMMFYGVFVRHNALIILIPYSFLLCFQRLAGKKNILAKQCAFTVVMVLLFVIIGKFYSSVSVPEKNKSYHIENSVFIWDLWGMSIELGKNVVPPYVLAESHRNISLKEMASHYLPYTNSIIFTPLLSPTRWSKKFPDTQFKKDFLLAVLHNPGSYIKVRSRVLGFMIDPANLFGQYLFGIQQFPEGDYLHAYSKQLNILNPVVLHWLEVWTFWLFHNTPLFAVWIYLALTIIQLLFFYLNRKRIVTASTALTILLAGFLYWSPYLIISTSADYRYSIFTIFCCIVTFPDFLKNVVKLGSQKVISICQNKGKVRDGRI